VQRHIWTRDDAQEITIMLRKRIIYALAAAALLLATAVGALHAGGIAGLPADNRATLVDEGGTDDGGVTNGGAGKVHFQDF
jgi:hypothetical protein